MPWFACHCLRMQRQGQWRNFFGAVLLLLGIQELSWAQGGPNTKKPITYPGFGDPAAVIVFIPHYSSPKLSSLESAKTPALDLAKTLAFGRYEVLVLMGSDGSEKADKTFEEVRSDLENFNKEKIAAKNEEWRKKQDIKIEDDVETPKFHNVEVQYAAFRNLKELQLSLQAWMSLKFLRKRAAPFGLMAFRGHGVSRIDDGDTLLMPNDDPAAGGFSLRALMNEARVRSIPLMAMWDMCRPQKMGDNGRLFPSEKPVFNPATSRTPPTEGSVAEQFAKLRFHSNRIPPSDGYAVDVIYSVKEKDEQPDNSDFSSMEIIAKGLMKSNNGTLELKSAFLDRKDKSQLEVNAWELFEYCRKNIESRSAKKLTALWTPGPIEPLKIIYSLDENFVYSPVDVSPMLGVDLKQGQTIAVAEEGGSFIFRRIGDKYDEPAAAALNLNPDDGDFRGIPLNREDLILEVILEIESQDNKAIEFILQPHGLDVPVLSNTYSKVRSGSRLLGRHKCLIPLNRVKAQDGKEPPYDRLAHFAVSTKVLNGKDVDDLEKSWNKGASIRIYSMRLLSKEQLQQEAREAKTKDPKAPDVNLLISGEPIKIPIFKSLDLQEHWWPNESLRRDQNTRVNKFGLEIGGTLVHQITLDRTHPNEYSGGIEGPISPAPFVDPKHHRLEVVVRRGSETTEKAKIALLVESPAKTLLQDERPLLNDGKTLTFQFSDRGVARWFGVIVAGRKDVTIESIKLIDSRK